jgi:hypothetical protein
MSHSRKCGCCRPFGGRNGDYGKTFTTREELRDYLKGLSTYGRFLRFAMDFRKKEGYSVCFKEITLQDQTYISISLKDACEFMSRKDYIDNWQSEMHETFCFWDFNEWRDILEKTGFRVLPYSHAYTNEWIVENRFKGKVELFEESPNGVVELSYPVTNMILVAEKQ